MNCRIFCFNKDEYDDYEKSINEFMMMDSAKYKVHYILQSQSFNSVNFNTVITITIFYS